MTTKTEITLPPLPMPIRGSAFVRGHAPDDDRLREWGRAAVEADRADHLRDATKMMTADELAQEIRRVDGKHSMGAGALAEALMPFLRRSSGQDREDAQRYRAFFDAGLPVTFLGEDYRDKSSLDAAIDAARAAKGADHA